MSKAGKVAAAIPPGPGPEPQAVPFEEALSKLQAVVETMESDDLPLETLLAQFEEGTRLVRVCQAKLAEAEVKIQQLEKNANEEGVLRPFAEPEEGNDGPLS